MVGIHTHVSATHVFYTFVGVLVAGTFWRIGAAALVNKFPEGTMLNALGQAAASQF